MKCAILFLQPIQQAVPFRIKIIPWLLTDISVPGILDTTSGYMVSIAATTSRIGRRDRLWKTLDAQDSPQEKITTQNQDPLTNFHSPWSSTAAEDHSSWWLPGIILEPKPGTSWNLIGGWLIDRSTSLLNRESNSFCKPTTRDLECRNSYTMLEGPRHRLSHLDNGKVVLHGAISLPLSRLGKRPCLAQRQVCQYLPSTTGVQIQEVLVPHSSGSCRRNLLELRPGPIGNTHEARGFH